MKLGGDERRLDGDGLAGMLAGGLGGESGGEHGLRRFADVAAADAAEVTLDDAAFVGEVVGAGSDGERLGDGHGGVHPLNHGTPERPRDVTHVRHGVVVGEPGQDVPMLFRDGMLRANGDAVDTDMLMGLVHVCFLHVCFLHLADTIPQTVGFVKGFMPLTGDFIPQTREAGEERGEARRGGRRGAAWGEA